ncbi:hypothetical protein BDR26DRAFT_916545 [Obelidium mucronatum]|nr:hypothetical protein BDR26DRAFT_916545 [Obelidium mucronatum]
MTPVFSLALFLALVAAARPLADASTSAEPAVIGYLLLDAATGFAKLNALANSAATLPLTRIVLSFARPDLVYLPFSHTLKHVGLNLAVSETSTSNTSSSAVSDYGFASLKTVVGKLQAGGVQVYLAKNSIAYFATGPNAWKLTEYGSGTSLGCTELNQYCYVCEPPSQGTSLADFSIFPEPYLSPTWMLAQSFVTSNAGGATPVWHPELVGGNMFGDSTGRAVVPGTSLWKQLSRDPYQDLVYLVKDLGLDGIDLDYEEIWHADTFRSGSGVGPFMLDQTVYKYTAIAQDLIINIQAIYPKCKLSVAASAAGAWAGNWFGGNLKGLWYYSNLWYPSVTQFMTAGTNAGGVNVMTYDLSKNPTFHECPSSPETCDLAGQVSFYLSTFTPITPAARIGFEIGVPAYPDSVHDALNQLPLTQHELSNMLSFVSGKGAIVWELYKDVVIGGGQVNASTVLQQVCNMVFNAQVGDVRVDRCNGVIPRFN